ncbi:hypothetical protein CEXT_18191 [Caerostris extrusa]|uniref:Uncharacterized protein n=1 Tax=Caerostris extrusa TaxID=172846 RepID=A0AAV4M2R2_CAEEX|nr:hypothetical protein CEXT_18191 [Caerostris extrusa]
MKSRVKCNTLGFNKSSRSFAPLGQAAACLRHVSRFRTGKNFLLLFADSPLRRNTLPRPNACSRSYRTIK